MNNKGFAITGIIYTLFILFLMILLTVLTGLSSYQRLMINSTRSLENSYKGVPIEGVYFNEMKEYGDANVFGKYIFELKDNGLECSAYLNKGFSFKDYKSNDFSNDGIYLSPYDCNDYSSDIELIKVYSFEVSS